MIMENGELVPDLRFPEFEGGWKSNKFGDIASFSKGKGLSKSDIDESGDLECIRYGELYTHYSEVIDSVISRTNAPKTKLILSEADDVIIPASGETQIDIATASCVRKSGVALSGDLNIIKSKLNGVFLAYYLNNKKKLDIARLSQGISVVHLYSSQLKSLTLNFPDDEEQQKIANFLTAIDQRITLFKEKKAALEDYKKGLMQKIFSQEVRFVDDEGNDFPDWEDKRLGNMFEIQGGGTPSTTTETYWGNEINWFTPTEIKSKYSRESNRKITTLGLNKSSAKLLPKGTLLLTTRATIADMSICTEECTTNQGFQSFLPNDSHDLEYLYYWISNNKKVFIRKSSGSTFLEISKKEIKKIKIKIPSLKEQQKIANFLSNIDQKINAMDKQITDSELFKKGLLQRMFV